MKITEDLIGYISELSRLQLTEEEKEGAKMDLTDILNYMEELNGLDTSGRKEMTHPFEEANRFRNEDVLNEDQREEMLKNAPDTKGDYFKVFKTVE